MQKAILQVDYLQNTAGDIALSYNDDEIYYAIRNEGIRAGILVQRRSFNV